MAIGGKLQPCALSTCPLGDTGLQGCHLASNLPSEVFQKEAVFQDIEGIHIVADDMIIRSSQYW